jgi:hypothetical protein
MQIFDQKSRREVSLGGLHIWSDNINMDVWKIGCKDVDLINLAQDSNQWWAVVIMVMNLQAL